MHTNDALYRAGLATIYAPNQYDRMILMAVACIEPLDILAGIFETASDEEKVRERIEELQDGMQKRYEQQKKKRAEDREKKRATKNNWITKLHRAVIKTHGGVFVCTKR